MSEVDDRSGQSDAELCSATQVTRTCTGLANDCVRLENLGNGTDAHSDTEAIIDAHCDPTCGRSCVRHCDDLSARRLRHRRSNFGDGRFKAVGR
jgi:hypothetical protein